MAASSMASALSICCICALCLLSSASSSSSCLHQSTLFLNALQSQCPLSSEPFHSLLEVDGSYLDRALTSNLTGKYVSVLFYASWCPFSRIIFPAIENLGLMFPLVEHLAIEQSSAMPSVFSRNGVHSLPSLLMISRASRVRYHGPKDLASLVQFYKKTTGLDPVYVTGDQSTSSVGSKKSLNNYMEQPLLDMFIEDSCLVFSVLFLCMRLLLLIIPSVFSSLKVFMISYAPHLNLEIFGETSQILGRVLHMIELKRIWTKLGLGKTRHFHGGATNARVWASSLASVSLGEASLARSS